MYRIALVSREVSPFPPLSGLGAYVNATAGVLAADAEVTIVTSDRHEELYEALRGESSPDLPKVCASPSCGSRARRRPRISSEQDSSGAPELSRS